MNIIPLSAQSDIVVVGKVVDELNEPLIGVNIVIKNTTIGTVTDENGQFEIKTTDQQSTIVVSYIGFQTKEIALNGQTNLIINLSENSKELEEVIVVGYGTMKKSDLTGSVSQVSVESISKSSQSNFQNFLQGRSPGVQVTSSSGDPSGGIKVEIRGANSLTANTDPLYVIDGIPYDFAPSDALSNSYAGGQASNPMTNINPNDIASIEILKDASATAIYGSRGANGVILITTKTGQAGKPKVDVSYFMSFSSMSKKIDLLNSHQYAELSNEAKKYRYPDGAINFTDEELAALPSFDHTSAIMQTGLTNDLNVSVSGGNESTKYYLSTQYYDQEGIVRNTGLTRYNIKMNLEQKLSTKLTLNALINLSRTESQMNVMGGWNGGVILSMLRWAPTSPLKSADGTYNIYPNYMVDGNGVIKERFKDDIQDASTYMNNPLAIVERLRSDNTNNQVLTNLGLTYEINKNLKANVKGSVSTYNSLLEAYRPTTVPIIGSITQGYATLGNTQFLKTLFEGTLSYNKNFKKHFVNGVIGATAESSERKQQRASSKDFLQDITGSDAIQAGSLLESPFSEYYDYALISYLLRVNYHYNYKYYAVFSGRADGSSKFAKSNRWGYFPSLGLSWRVNKESFFKNIKSINELKLRTSAGITGNQGIPSYQTLLQVESGESRKTNYNFGNKISTGYAPARLPNTDLTWEQTKQYNAGLDLHMFDSRLMFTADIYRKETTDLLYNIDIPATSGYERIYKNIGSMRNEGLELTLSGDPISTNTFRWNSSFNISWNRNEIAELNGLSEAVFVGEVFNGLYASKLEVGKPIGNFYGYKTDGIWDAESLANKPSSFQPGAREGDRRYKDIKKDDVL
ncbi:MAG: TonB-dependent receptor, partial [Prevotellaceae bacterium]|nr:TonB-dependent receptor [Prevotellaceae bacterium]